MAQSAPAILAAIFAAIFAIPLAKLLLARTLPLLLLLLQPLQLLPLLLLGLLAGAIPLAAILATIPAIRSFAHTAREAPGA
eukprot:831987-Alexandrium_andersonii.AAC.1